MRRIASCFALVLAACGGSGTVTDAGLDAGRPSGDSAVPDIGVADGSCATDSDRDGHVSTSCGGDDCDDADANRYPGNAEVCDGADHDEDCDARTFGFRDMDGDTFPDGECCNRDGATMHCGVDCDDTCPSCNPGASEVCDTRDNDCDGMVDEAVIGTFYRDDDGDMFGVDGMTVMACSPPAGYAIVGGDCNDTAGSGGGANPGVPENPCNGVDDDCDLMTDEGSTTVTCSADPDGDTYAVAGAASTMRSCTCLANETARLPVDATSIDCLEGPAAGAASVHPLQAEIPCNGIDDDCDGNPADTARTCTPGERRDCSTGCGPLPGTQTCNATCSGFDATCMPPGEICNGFDDDCAGGADTGSACTYGMPHPAAATCAGFSIPCSQPCLGNGSSVCTLDTQCDPTTTTWVWNGTDGALGHGVPACGTACFGTVWCAFGPCASVQYGPYVRLPPGTYSVTFDLRATSGIGLEWDVVRDGGADILVPATRETWFCPSGGDCDALRTFSFTVGPGCGAVEFRMSWESGSGGLAIRSTTLRLTSARVTPS